MQETLESALGMIGIEIPKPVQIDSTCKMPPLQTPSWFGAAVEDVMAAEPLAIGRQVPFKELV